MNWPQNPLRLEKFLALYRSPPNCEIRLTFPFINKGKSFWKGQKQKFPSENMEMMEKFYSFCLHTHKQKWTWRDFLLLYATFHDVQNIQKCHYHIITNIRTFIFRSNLALCHININFTNSTMKNLYLIAWLLQLTS